MNGMAFGFASTSAPQPQGTSAPSFKSHQELKTALHRDLLNKIDLEKLTSLQDVRARTQVQNVILDLIGAANVPLSGAEKERICREVLHEVFGLGPLELLKSAVKARLNIIVSGGTGAGKTTLLNVLSSFISKRERIVTIEDSAELQMQQPHVVRMECRPPNVEGKGAVRQRELVINALRMRPDRIVIGEVCGGEALDMLQAMNTGHDGTITTIHANSSRDTIARLETMSLMAEVKL